MRPGTLYRFYGPEGLIYVGVTTTANRFDQHRTRGSDWFHRATRIELEHFADWPDAVLAEQRAIDAEKPLVNRRNSIARYRINGGGRRKSTPPAGWGQNIRRHRKRTGLSQCELAKSVGADQTSLSNWERGAYAPALDFKLRLAEVLGVPVEDLFPWPAAS